FGMLRHLIRGLGENLGVARKDTDGTRNADKPFSDFHISHHRASFIPAHGFMAGILRMNADLGWMVAAFWALRKSCRDHDRAFLRNADLRGRHRDRPPS